jgi:hypothetical protein
MRFRITLSEERNNFCKIATTAQIANTARTGCTASWGPSGPPGHLAGGHLPQGTPSWGLPAIPNYVRRRGSAIPITLWCAEPPRRLGGGGGGGGGVPPGGGGFSGLLARGRRGPGPPLRVGTPSLRRRLVAPTPCWRWALLTAFSRFQRAFSAKSEICAAAASSRFVRLSHISHLGRQVCCVSP